MATPPADHRAPDGAQCGVHPERAAQFTCPRCGSYACVTCWHPEVERCTHCLQRDPAAAAPPILWEQRDKSLARRYVGTIASALSPFRTAPAFAHGEVGDALRFMLLSALPLALLSGVIPHTRTLMFAGNFAVRVLGHPSAMQIGLDVLRSMLVGFALIVVQLATLLLPFASLLRAYAPARRGAAQRALYYRIWLLPAALLFFHIAMAVLPPPPDPTMLDPNALEPATATGLALASGVRLLCAVLLILTMSATARLACGLGPFLATVVVIVPLLVMLFGGSLAELGVVRLLPDLPAAASRSS
jgi:hypothetical protein